MNAVLTRAIAFSTLLLLSLSANAGAMRYELTTDLAPPFGSGVNLQGYLEFDSADLIHSASLATSDILDFEFAWGFQSNWSKSGGDLARIFEWDLDATLNVLTFDLCVSAASIDGPCTTGRPLFRVTGDSTGGTAIATPAAFPTEIFTGDGNNTRWSGPRSTSVSLPATLTLFTAGLFVLGWSKRRRIKT